MTMFARLALACLVAGSVLLQSVAQAAEPLPGPLVDAGWLARNLGRHDVLVLDASMLPLHKAAHIPGAVHANVFDYGGADPAPARMERHFQSWGIAPGRKLVLYDEGGSFMATRLFYDLHYHGFPVADMAVLDGGLSQWRAAGGNVTAEPTPAPPKGTFVVTRVNAEARVRLDDVLVASGDPANNALVEALDASWHFGETAFFDRAGHIPHGIMLPSDDFFAADKTFRSPADIRRMLDYLGVRRDQRILAYCGGGIAASVPWFAAKFLLGYPDVRLFQESELGWMRDDRGLPVWTYDAPYLLRESAWLKTWGGRMLRMYGASSVSIVDVRSPEAFAQGRVPFAVNVPASVFRAHLAQPAKLGEVLAQAGVDPAHEAVVVGESGLTPGAALAWLVLDRLGQRRVSVLADSLVRWAEVGGEVTRDATPVARRNDYAATPRGSAVVADAAGTKGPYPKVFVASGRALPAKLPEGRVVHVPYADLLDAEGRPKPAKELWKLLAKAGVPRYAELVTVAEDPGEAAVAYFVLKLMGWPDVKLLPM